MAEQLLVPDKSKEWHRVWSEAHTVGLTLEKAKDMSITQMLAWMADKKEYNPQPQPVQTNVFEEAQKQKQDEIKNEILLAEDSQSLLAIWNKYPRLQKEEWFLQDMRDRKLFLIDEGKIKPKAQQDYTAISKPINEGEYPTDDSIPF